MTTTRALQAPILADLAERMVFVAGPRQVGKTTLARHVLTEFDGVYLNWDNRDDRREVRAALARRTCAGRAR